MKPRGAEVHPSSSAGCQTQLLRPLRFQPVGSSLFPRLARAESRVFAAGRFSQAPDLLFALGDVDRIAVRLRHIPGCVRVHLDPVLFRVTEVNRPCIAMAGKSQTWIATCRNDARTDLLAGGTIGSALPTTLSPGSTTVCSDMTPMLSSLRWSSPGVVWGPRTIGKVSRECSGLDLIQIKVASARISL